MKQKTLAKQITHTGIGLHKGENVTLTLKPADGNQGIIFKRTDVTENNTISAKWDNVSDTTMCTVVSNKAKHTVGTIEHIMSALYACGIDNVIIETDAPEPPINDGSAIDWLNLIQDAGALEQSAARKSIKILKEIRVTHEDKYALLKPAAQPQYAMTIDFPHPAIGKQEYDFTFDFEEYKAQIAPCRTFGFFDQVEYLRKNGLALGGSLDNAVVFNDQGVMNDGGLRFANECVRHKILDAIGDLYLAGAPIIGRYEGYKASHDLNNKLLHALFADETAFTFE